MAVENFLKLMEYSFSFVNEVGLSRFKSLQVYNPTMEIIMPVIIMSLGVFLEYNVDCICIEKAKLQIKLDVIRYHAYNKKI